MKWYNRCFSSLYQSEIPVQIIVIDNASSDETVDYIKKNYPEIILIESKENLGFAKANNMGLKYALDHDADYIFLLNQDAWINQTNTIATLIEQSKQNSEYAILSPLQLYGSANKIEQEVLMHFARNAKSNDDIISDLYFNRLKDIYEIPYACAVCWLLPISTIKNIGGFDPLFYHYGEDDNYIQRVKFFGYKIGICPKVSISHDIELRPKEYRNENLNWKKYLLIQIADININYSFDLHIKKLKRVILIQTIRLNKKLVKDSLSKYRYLISIKEELIRSRTQNKQKQSNWL